MPTLITRTFRQKPSNMGFFCFTSQSTIMKAIQLNLFKPSSQLDFYCEDGYFKAYDEDARIASDQKRDVLTLSLIRQADIYLPRLVRAGYKIKMIGI